MKRPSLLRHHGTPRIQRVLEYGLRFSTEIHGSKRFSTNIYRTNVLLLQTSPNISGNLRDLSGECNLGILYSSSLLMARLQWRLQLPDPRCGCVSAAPRVGRRRPSFCRGGFATSPPAHFKQTTWQHVGDLWQPAYRQCQDIRGRQRSAATPQSQLSWEHVATCYLQTNGNTCALQANHGKM